MSKAVKMHWTVFIPEQVDGRCSSCKFAILKLTSDHPERKCDGSIDEDIEIGKSSGNPWITINIDCRVSPVHSATEIDNFCSFYIKCQPQVLFVAERNGRGGTIEWVPTIEPLKIVEARE